ncbi:MAG TPA: SurA N-terminal domain-containing protein [Pyrinomonadaceae bacterium]
MRNTNFRFLTIAVLAFVILALTGCPTGGSGNGSTTGPPDPNETAASVNGKAIKLEEVEKAVKAQGQGQEAKFSPLELASARLSVLQQLIQAEVLYQKAEKEQAVPNDEDVNAEVNKRKNASGLSQEEFERQMKEAGETEQSWRENVKRELALQKLQDKITNKVESPKEDEIKAFYEGNKDQFKNKRGAQLAAIVIDPTNSGEGDTTRDEAEANLKAKEIGSRALTGSDFATLARENSEDLQTRSNGGDWRYFTEDELKQTLGAGVADFIMNKMQNGQIIPQAIPLEGKILIIKLQRKQEKDEDVTLETPGTRQRVTELLINARKNLLWQSYMAIAMNEAKVENFLAQKVINNPNELSGARPAGAMTPANTNTNANANANTNANVNANIAPKNANANANVKPAAKANANTNTK